MPERAASAGPRAAAYIGDLLPGVFDRTVKLDDVPDGYTAMASRESLKVMIRPRGVRKERRSAGPSGRVGA